jgi:hypothetical protein
MAERVARCWGLLSGHRPQISRPLPAAHELSEPLEYRFDRLLGTGFDLRGDADAEITATLRFCSTLSPQRAT